MSKKSPEQKELERSWEALNEWFSFEMQKRILRFKNLQNRLFSWIWKKILLLFSLTTKILRGFWAGRALFILILFIELWYLGITNIPPKIWQQTPEFDSAATLTEVDKITGDASKQDEQALINQINLAMSLERKGDFDAALAQYQTTQKSTLPTIRNYSNVGIKRVQERLSQPFTQVEYYINNFFIKTPSWITTILGVLLLLMVLVVVYYAIPRRPGFEISEFATPKSEDEEADFALEVRQTLADTIALIQFTHQASQENSSLLTEQLTIPSFSLSGGSSDEVLSALIQLGDAPILQTTGISISKILNSAQLFLRRRQYLLVGSLNKLDNQWYLTTKMLDARNKQLIHQWEFRETELSELLIVKGSNPSGKEQSIEIIRKLSRALAYKMLYTLLKENASSMAAKSWRIFYHLTEGLWGIQEYAIDSSATTPRDFAVAHFEQVVTKLDFGNRIAKFDLALLYLLQGDILKAIKSFEELKIEVETILEPIVEKVFQRFISDWNKGKPSSMILRDIWKNFPTEIEKIGLTNLGGVWAGKAKAWDELPQNILDYRNNQPSYVYEKAVRAELKLLLAADDDVGMLFRVLVGFPKDIKTENAIERFIEILNSQDQQAFSLLMQSLNGKNEANASLSQEIAKILDHKHIYEMNSQFKILCDRVDLLRKSHLLPESEQTISQVAGDFDAFSKQVGLTNISRWCLKLADDIREKNWKSVKIDIDTLKRYLSKSDPNAAKSDLQRLLLANEPPALLKIYSFLEPEKTADYLSLYEANRQPIYLETMYNLALSHYLAFSSEGYIKAIDYINEIMSLLKSRRRLLSSSARQDELRSICSCLNVNIYMRAYLNFDDATEPITLLKRFEKLPEWLGEFNVHKDDSFGGVPIGEIHDFTYHESINVRVAAFETLGLWHMRRSNDQESQRNFQSAMSLRSWASSYIYLAESYAQNKDYDEALHFLNIAKRQMPKLTYIHYLEKLWRAKLAEKDVVI